MRKAVRVQLAIVAGVIATGLASVPAMSAATVAASSGAAAKVCDVAKYGAKGDGVTKDTKAIQAAIDACTAKGGGIVTLSKGIFLSGPIVLKDNVTLNLAAGTMLLGSPDHADYREGRRQEDSDPCWHASAEPQRLRRPRPRSGKHSVQSPPSPAQEHR